MGDQQIQYLEGVVENAARKVRQAYENYLDACNDLEEAFDELELWEEKERDARDA